MWLIGLFLVGLAWGVVCTPTADGGEIGFVEEVALSTDRRTAIRQLVPGTETGSDTSVSDNDGEDGDGIANVGGGGDDGDGDGDGAEQAWRWRARCTL